MSTLIEMNLLFTRGPGTRPYDMIQEYSHEIWPLHDTSRIARGLEIISLPLFPSRLPAIYRYRNVTAVVEYEPTKMDVSRINRQPSFPKRIIFYSAFLHFSPFRTYVVLSNATMPS